MSQVYFLNGASCVSYDTALDAVVASEVPLTSVWPGLGSGFESGYDAGLNYGDGKAYLFLGDSYVRVDIATGAVETEVRSIAEFWTGMAEVGFDSDLDAAVNYGNGTVYFFKGLDWCSYGIAEDRVLETGPTSGWVLAPDGSFDGDLDAVVNYGNGKLYFFRDDCYVRFDLATAAADTEVRRVADHWTGMSEAGFTSGLDGSWCDADPAGSAAPSGGGTATGSADPAALVDGADIEAYFVATTGVGFIDWFNANHANTGAFAPTPKRRYEMKTDPDTRARFVTFWNTIPLVFETPTIRLEQFLALQTICINELGGGMAPVSEMFGTAGHPGIAYLFDAISGLKASYNSGAPPRKTALDCFNDQGFLDAHAALPHHADVAHTTDPVWAGTVYPVDRFPTGITEAGIIAQADFCKFRGRGMIQTTWREGYLGLIDFVQSYTGTNAVVLAAQQRWSAMTREQVAFASSNADWDELFQRSDYVVPAAGIRLHSHMKGGYLDISTDPAVRHGQDRGSYWFMGRHIAGSSSYGTLFSDRCQQLRASLP